VKLPLRSALDRLFERPERYGFFQAVRLLHRWFAMQEHVHGHDVFRERLRFRNHLSLSFPASEVASFDWIDDDPAPDEATHETVPRHSAGLLPQRNGDLRPGGSSRAPRGRVEMSPAFMSLLGAGGALPIFYSELFAQREIYHRDTAGRAFLDLFLHRAVVLFYQAWRKHRLVIGYEDDQQQHFQPLVMALGGFGHPALRQPSAARSAISGDALAYYASALQRRPVSATTIQQVLGGYFGVPMHLEQFVGRWFGLPQEHQTSLGLALLPGGGQLGSSAIVGERVWQRDLRMRLTVGPLRRGELQDFLPGGRAARALTEWLTLLTGQGFEYEIRLSLRAEEVLTTQLGGDSTARLGWTTFLQTRPAANDRADAGYDIHAAA